MLAPFHLDCYKVISGGSEYVLEMIFIPYCRFLGHFHLTCVFFPSGFVRFCPLDYSYAFTYKQTCVSDILYIHTISILGH